MEEARNSLADFILDEKPLFVPVDERALSGQVSPTSAKTTDWYLANLAQAHGMQWATLDQAAKHPAAVLIT